MMSLELWDPGPADMATWDANLRNHFSV